MNSQLQTAIGIKSQAHSNNLFVFKIPANSTSQQLIHLSISCHILKKLALIDISQSRQTADLYKQCLLDVIEHPSVDLKCKQTLQEILYFLQYWQQTMGKAASWPHTRTCFYYLQEKLKKNKYFQQLDIVRLKRAHLEPNKKEFLSQIMAQNIHSQQLKAYIAFLKDQHESSEYSFNMNKPIIKQEKVFVVDHHHHEDEYQRMSTNLNKLKNVLYSDTRQDWGYFSKVIESLLQNQKHMQGQQTQKDLKFFLVQTIQTYILEKLPIFINQLKSHNPREFIMKQLNFRKSIIMKIATPELLQILNMTISKIKYNHSSK